MAGDQGKGRGLPAVRSELLDFSPPSPTQHAPCLRTNHAALVKTCDEARRAASNRARISFDIVPTCFGIALRRTPPTVRDNTGAGRRADLARQVEIE